MGGLTICEGCIDPSCPTKGCALTRCDNGQAPVLRIESPVRIPLTEDDIRRIVREEITNAMASRVKP